MGKIVHIVLWKFKGTTPEEKEAAKADVQRLLKVPGAISMHVGPPEIDARAKGFEYGLYSVFESRKALDEYAVSKAHMDVVAFIKPHAADVMAYDWELSE